jgi:transposase
MARTTKLLTEEVVALSKSNLQKLGKRGGVAIKLRAIISAHKLGITKAAEAFDITKASIISWIKHVKEGSFELLSVQEGRGRVSKITDKHKTIIKGWLINDPQLTIDKVRLRIISELGIEAGRSSVHRAMKALDFSYITPRPRHHKQDAAITTEIKKKSNRAT